MLTKFHDAKYIDSRDGSEKKGAQLASGRINRNHNKDKENLRKHRLRRTQEGYTTLRTAEYKFRPGDMVAYNGAIYAVGGAKNNGDAVVLLRRDKTVNPSVNSVKGVRRADGWKHLL